MADKEEVGIVSRCCNAPVYFVHECGPVCTECRKWTVTMDAGEPTWKQEQAYERLETK